MKTMPPAFKAALQETKAMSENILQNGIKGYKTLDELLNEDLERK